MRRFHQTLLACIVLCTPVVATANEITTKRDLVYGHKDGLAMTMDQFTPKKPNGAAVLFMVSGGWVSKFYPAVQMRPFLDPFLAEGFTVFAVRHGSSPRYTIPEAVADVRRAVRFVHAKAKTLEVDPKRMGVFGMSAGGHLALMLGTTGDDGDATSSDDIARASSRVAAVVALVPPTDLRVAVWDAPESLPAYRGFPALNLDLKRAKEHSPLVHVTSDDAPALVVMGGNDKLVPPKHGEWIDAAFAKAKVPRKLIIHEGSGHALEGNQMATFKEAVSWFQAHLGSNQ